MQFIIWGRRGGFATWVSEHSQVPGRLLARDCRYHIASAAPLPLPGYWKNFILHSEFSSLFVVLWKAQRTRTADNLEQLKMIYWKKKISSEFVVSSLNNNNMSDNMLNIFSNKSSVFSWGKKKHSFLPLEMIKHKAIFCMLADNKACCLSMFLVSFWEYKIQKRRIFALSSEVAQSAELCHFNSGKKAVQYLACPINIGHLVLNYCFFPKYSTEAEYTKGETFSSCL